MRKLATIIACTLFTPGCIIVTGGDDDDPAGAFEVSWTLLSAEDDQPLASCPPAATTAAVHIVDPDTGDEFAVDCFDCNDFSGITADLPLGPWDVFVDITDAAPGPQNCGSGTLLAPSPIAETSLEVDGELVGVDFEFIGDGGQLRADWVLEDAQGELGCSQVEQDGIGFLSTFVGPNSAFDDRFDCEGDDTCGAQCGTTAPLPVGDYEVVVDVIDSEGAALASCEDPDGDTQVSTDIPDDYVITDLGTFFCPIQ